MVASTFPTSRIAQPVTDQADAALSDFEIARRVAAIRSQWTAQERVERRFEAMRRFDTLLDSLELRSSPCASTNL